MKSSGRMIRIGLACAFIAGTLAFGGCTKYASPDDLKKLEAAESAAISAEKDVDKAKVERRQVEKQLGEKKAELDAAKAELEQVKNR